MHPGLGAQAKGLCSKCSGYDLLHERILPVAVGAHAVLVQIFLSDVHPEDQHGNQTKI